MARRMARPTARTVAIVPHTHWDREWYASFAAFRLRLLDVLDGLLAELAADGAYRHFLLDGQMAVVDDYLELRPEAADVLGRLAGAGRLSVGPWYILSDEFCVSGETLIRNLQLGLSRAAALGGATEVGYLPDMFGHIAQMPQILAAAGMTHAVVWRGVPAAVDRTAFWWSAPDGTRVRAAYLPVGYSNGAATPTDAEALVRRIRAHEREIAGFLRPEDPLLWMNGTDHQAPQPWLPKVVAEANVAQDDYRLEISSLAEHLATAPTGSLPCWTGELRSGARTNLLMGVLSNRVDIKAAAARAERELERRAEPLSALWLPPGRWPQAVLDDAWLEMVRNSAHDSICACSADAVGTAVLHRFADATDAAAGLAERALAGAAGRFAEAGPVVVNPSAHTRDGVVELIVSGTAAPAGAQLLDAVEAGETELRGHGGDLGRLLGELMVAGWLPPSGTPSDAAVTAGPDGVTVELVVARTTGGAGRTPSVGPAMAEAWAQAGAARTLPLTVRVRRPASARILVRAGEVPGFGWRRYAPDAGQPGDRPVGAPVRAGRAPDGGVWLDNGQVQVTVNPVDGTFALGDLPGLGQLVDSRDAGDTYNYSPPATDAVVDRPATVALELVETGPVRARVAIRAGYRWPAGLDDERWIDVEVCTLVELHAGAELVRVTTAFDNPCRDHRLRAIFPLPRRATASVAECAFATVTRGLTAEGGPHEVGLATFPSRRFVSAGGLTVVHEGLLEYELIDGGDALALTLLRATGHLSRPAPAYRPNAAGPDLPVEGPQLVGPVQMRYGVVRARPAGGRAGSGPAGGPAGGLAGSAPAGSGAAVDPYRLAEDAWLPLEVVDAPGGGELEGERGSLLEVSGAEVSALHRVDGQLELRVFNPSPEPAEVTVAGRRGALVDLRGREQATWDGHFSLRPWGIATARLAE